MGVRGEAAGGFVVRLISANGPDLPRGVNSDRVAFDLCGDLLQEIRGLLKDVDMDARPAGTLSLGSTDDAGQVHQPTCVFR